MNLVGEIRGRFPYVDIPLPGHSGEILIAFRVDTAFEGELSVPAALMSRISYRSPQVRLIELANGAESRAAFVEVLLDWNGEVRVTDVLVTDGGNPLIGIELLAEHLLTIELTEGGEVAVEAL